MSSEIAIRARDISKHYVMFARPEDRLKQMIVPRLQRALGRPPTRYYRDFAALSGVSFDIRRGETVGIIGRNGSGKSTLLQIICGTLQPTSGSIEVNGRIAALLELGAGFNPEFTGRENVYLNAAILGLSRAEIDARFESIARFADIGDFIEQPVKTYSSGMYVRLAFATAINVDPDILVVDEALAVGDEAFQRKCYARIEQIKERGGTILFVSHSAQTVVQLCDRALLIDRGELILEGRPKLVTTQYQRLASTDPQNAQDVRASILVHRKDEPNTQYRSDNKIFKEAHSSGLTGSQQDDGDSSEQFDPNFVSKSMTHFEEQGASISNIKITTIKGKHVNVINLGKRYILSYDVTFSKNAKNVTFSFGIRTLSGVKITGFDSPSPNDEEPQNEKRHVQFEFLCNFLPQTLFASCAVRGTIDGQVILLHRIFDAICFRVATEVGLQSTGIVDIQSNATVSSEKSQQQAATRPDEALSGNLRAIDAAGGTARRNSPFYFVHHYPSLFNIGDYLCSPRHYFNFGTPNRKKTIIIAGGGVFGHPSAEIPIPDAIRIAWGVGRSTDPSAPSHLISDLENNFSVSSTRDKDISNDKVHFVPCVSAFSSITEIPPGSEIGVFLNANPVTSGLDARNAGLIFGKEFIFCTNASQERNFREKFAATAKIVTNSYHVAYWALLSGRSVSVIGYSSKFLSLGTLFDGLSIKNYQKGDGNALRESIEELLRSDHFFKLDSASSFRTAFRSLNLKFAQKLVQEGLFESIKLRPDSHLELERREREVGLLCAEHID